MYPMLSHVAALMLLLSFMPLAGRAAGASDGDGPAWTVVGADRMDLVVLEGDAPIFRLNNSVIGPAWRHSRLEGLAEVEQGQTRVFRQGRVGFFAQWWDREPMEGRFDLQYELAQLDGNTFRMRYVCTPEFDTAFGIPKGAEEKSVAVGPVLGPTQYFDGGTCLLTFPDGTTEELPLPPPRGHKPRVVSAELRTAGGETTRLRFEPPAVLHLDNNEMRCFAFQDVNGGTAMTQDVVLVLPRKAKFEPANRIVDISGWYPLDPEQVNNLSRPSLFGMEAWQDEPAGKHGFLQIRDDRFEFEDGTPVKFWGVNPLKVDQKVDEHDLSDRPLVAAPHRTGPVVLEPVVATIELKRKGPCRVFALDHGGRKAIPPVEVPVEQTAAGWRITLDGAAYKTPYYVMEFGTR